jgi:hypothetical protein
VRKRSVTHNVNIPREVRRFRWSHPSDLVRKRVRITESSASPAVPFPHGPAALPASITAGHSTTKYLHTRTIRVRAHEACA